MVAAYYADPTRVNEQETSLLKHHEYSYACKRVYPLITPIPQVNNELLLDTIVAVEVDDGHAGKRTRSGTADQR